MWKLELCLADFVFFCFTEQMLFSTRGAASLQEAEQSQVRYVGLRQSSTQGRGNLSKDLGKMNKDKKEYGM